MKNKKLIAGCSLAVIVAIVAFFIFYAGERGVGTYISKTYAGLYNQPNHDEGMVLLNTAQPGEELEVTSVSKKGWATINHPEHGKVYTNFFGLTPEKVKYPIDARNFYDGNESILIMFQCLLWLIFLIAGVMLICIMTGRRKPVLITAILLVAAEIAYVIIHLAYIAPADILFGTAFNSTMGVIIAFLINMIGLIMLGFTHYKLIKLIYSEVKKPDRTMGLKVTGWALIVFTVLFTIYITVYLIVMALVIAVIVAGVALGFAFLSFVLDYENSHKHLTKDPYSGKWTDGNDEYEVNEASGTARKKGFFEL